MFILLLLLLAQVIITPQINPLWLGWLSFNVEFFLLQVTLIFILLKLNSSLNMYQTLGYSFIVVILLSGYLFLEQLDVFACFLLVGESVIFLFALSMLVHLNVNNIVSYRLRLLVLISSSLGLLLPLLGQEALFSFYSDWYSAQTSSYNDLLSQYLCLYVYHYPLLIIVGVWLLGLTFLLVSLATISFVRQDSVKLDVSYVRQYQSLWSQWYKKPFINIINIFK